MSGTPQDSQHSLHDQERTETGTQLARVEVIDPTMALVFGQTEQPEISNFDGDARARWQLAALCKGGNVIKGDEALGEKIDVKYVYCHKIQVVGPTPGEIQDAVRTCLITPQNVVYAFVSNGVAADVCTMLKAFGRAPFMPPITIQVNQIRTRMGRTTYSIQPVL